MVGIGLKTLLALSIHTNVKCYPTMTKFSSEPMRGSYDCFTDLEGQGFRVRNGELRYLVAEFISPKERTLSVL